MASKELHVYLWYCSTTSNNCNQDCRSPSKHKPKYCSRKQVSNYKIVQFLCTAVHLILFFSDSFSRLIFLFPFIGILEEGSQQRNIWRKTREQDHENCMNCLDPPHPRRKTIQSQCHKTFHTKLFPMPKLVTITCTVQYIVFIITGGWTLYYH